MNSETKKRNLFLRYLIVLLDGILLGLVSIGIPGFSASTIAVIIGIYIVMVEAMANLFSNFKKSITFLLVLYTGYAIGSAIAAKTIVTLFNNYPLGTTIAIIGLILGSFPDTFIAIKGNYKKISGYIVFIIIAVGILCYNFFATKSDESVVFPTNFDIVFLVRMTLIGFITSATFIIPGVDFAIVFLSLGMYIPFTEMLSSFIDFGNTHYFSNLVPYARILLFYLLGYFTGVILLSKLIKILTRKYKAQTLFANAAFIVVAPIIVVKNCIFDNKELSSYHSSLKEILIDYDLKQTIVGLILAIISFALIFYIGYRHRQNERKRTEQLLSAVDTNVKELVEKKRKEKIKSNDENISNIIDISENEIIEKQPITKESED
ncbi:MAG: DUF368 domain-containing protein [Acholeplasmatales bacterium]|nr:DUF368 domain-containing protein [Acholeplasmatales bacterium]